MIDALAVADLNATSVLDAMLTNIMPGGMRVILNGEADMMMVATTAAAENEAKVVATTVTATMVTRRMWMSLVVENP